jgi:hypothetical protein
MNSNETPDKVFFKLQVIPLSADGHGWKERKAVSIPYQIESLLRAF